MSWPSEDRIVRASDCAEVGRVSGGLIYSGMHWELRGVSGRDVATLITSAFARTGRLMQLGEIARVYEASSLLRKGWDKIMACR